MDVLDDAVVELLSNVVGVMVVLDVVLGSTVNDGVTVVLGDILGKIVVLGETVDDVLTLGDNDVDVL